MKASANIGSEFHEVRLGMDVAGEGIGDRDEPAVHVRAHQVFDQLPGFVLVLAAFADADAPGGIGHAALAGVAVTGRQGGDAEIELRIALADEVHMGERVDHHADAAVDEFLDLVLFLLGEDAGRNDACVVERA